MKKIKNEIAVVKVPMREGIKEVNRKYSDLISDSINHPPDGGFTVDEMRIRLSIKEKCVKANGFIEFPEETELNKVKECVKKMRWAFLSEDILTFTDVILKS